MISFRVTGSRIHLSGRARECVSPSPFGSRPRATDLTLPVSSPSAEISPTHLTLLIEPEVPISSEPRSSASPALLEGVGLTLRLLSRSDAAIHRQVPRRVPRGPARDGSGACRGRVGERRVQRAHGGPSIRRTSPSRCAPFLREDDQADFYAELAWAGTDGLQGEESIGMAMVFTLASHLRESTSALVAKRVVDKQRAEDEAHQKEEEVRLPPTFRPARGTLSADESLL